MKARSRDRSPEDHAALELLRGSRVWAGLRALVNVVAAAMASSASASLIRLAQQRWRHAPLPNQLHAIGVLLITASIVHLTATLSLGDYAGWLWLVLPGLAVMIGMLLLGAHRHHRRESV